MSYSLTPKGGNVEGYIGYNTCKWITNSLDYSSNSLTFASHASLATCFPSWVRPEMSHRRPMVQLGPSYSHGKPAKGSHRDIICIFRWGL